jgi:flagella basal body P-ring formation protein FlgA
MARSPGPSGGLAALLLLAGVAATQAADSSVRLPVPAISIFPGDKITAEKLTERDFAELYVRRIQSIDSKDILIGKVARRTLMPGQPIPANAVESARVVLRGVPAQIMLVSGSLQITAMGTPLDSAAAGQAVQARNIDTGLVVRGVAQADGTIRIGGLGGS